MFIAAVSAEVFVDDFIKPSSLFTYLFCVTMVTGIITLAVDIDIST